MTTPINDTMNFFHIPSNNGTLKLQHSKEIHQQSNQSPAKKPSLLGYKQYQNMIQWNGQDAKLIRAVHANAKHGDREAQYNLGCMYLTGNQVEINIEEAMGWLKCAANHGHVQAQYNLSWLYGTGCDGINKNEQEALFWLRKAPSH